MLGNTKIIETGIEGLEYPVGEHISINKDRIIELVKAFGKIKKFEGEELNLICRGSSGAIIASFFSMILPNSCTISHIKKDGENAHSYNTHIGTGKVIIVDDFIGTGETMNEIYKVLKSIRPNVVIDCVCVTRTDKLHKLDFKPRIMLCSIKC